MSKIHKQALDSKFYSRDLFRLISYREYFSLLLCTLIEEGESFNGKRPLSGSGWEDDLIQGLAVNKHIEGEFVQEENAFCFTYEQARSGQLFLKEMIKEL